MSDIGLTVGDLRRQLHGLSDDMKLSFSGGLTFYRLKHRADDHIFIEFNEIEAHLDEMFRKRHPNVTVAFVRTDGVEPDTSN